MNKMMNKEKKFENMEHVFYADRLVVKNVTVVNGASSFEEASLLTPNVSDVVLSGGVFESFQVDSDTSGMDVIDGSGCYLIPGFVDLQLNDFEWMDKHHALEAHIERFGSVVRNMLMEGVTTFLMASLAMPWEQLLEYLRALHESRLRPILLPFANGARELCCSHVLFGAMVEGTFMNRRFRGCHNASYVHDVVAGDWPDKLRLICQTGSVRSINVAPETNPQECLKMIESARVEHDVLVAAGHCQPTAHQLGAAVDAGISYVIHLGNGHTGLSWKKFHGGGMLEESLRNDKLHVTIIADGFHISKHYVRDWISRKELHRVSLVTDRAFSFDCPQEFSVFGINGRREDTDEGSFLRVFNKGDPPLSELLSPTSTVSFSLFGSHASMIRTMENCVNWFTEDMEGVSVRRHPAFSLLAALSISVALCCSNPARLARANAFSGSIEKGKPGNAVLLKIEDIGGRKRVRIVHVFVGSEKKK